MTMTDEELTIHRELQLLRAAGTAGSHRRRGKRRNVKPVNKSAGELESWVQTRHDKMDAIR